MKREAALQRIEIQKLTRDRDDMDLDLYRKSLEKASALRINGQLARLRLHQDINKVLTEEQIEALKSDMDKSRPSADATAVLLEAGHPGDSVEERP